MICKLGGEMDERDTAAPPLNLDARDTAVGSYLSAAARTSLSQSEMEGRADDILNFTRGLFSSALFFFKPQASSSRMHRTNFRFLCLIIRLICKSLPPRRRAMPIDNSRCPPRFPLRYSARRYTHDIGMVPTPCFPYSNSTRID